MRVYFNLHVGAEEIAGFNIYNADDLNHAIAMAWEEVESRFVSGHDYGLTWTIVEE